LKQSSIVFKTQEPNARKQEQIGRKEPKAERRERSAKLQAPFGKNDEDLPTPRVSTCEQPQGREY
jgi:hypothetical protein